MAVADPAVRVEVLALQVGDGSYAVPISAVVEVLPMVELAPLPDASEWLAGMLNFRGSAFPVVDLRKRLRARSAPIRLSTPIVVVTTGVGGCGLIADSVHDVFTAEAEPGAADDAMLRAVARDAPFEGIVRSGDRLLLALDVERIATAADHASTAGPASSSTAPHAER
jgi:purine-binding chemotaxis protein CheW